MSTDPGSAAVEAAVRVPAAASGELRFMLGVQRVRAATYLFAGGLTLVFKMIGLLDAPWLGFFGAMALAALSAVALHVVYARGLDVRWGVKPHHAWMPLDVAIVTLAVYLTGGAASPWFLFYIVTLAAAAFIGDRRTAALIGVANIGCYMSLLTWMGHIRGLDESLSLPLLRIVFLHAGSIAFIQGATNLRAKRLQVKRLQAEQAVRVEELVRLTKELGEANVQIRQADEMKSQFLANMSHELRTPLNAIIGFSEILMGTAGQDERRRAQYLGNVHTSGRHLLSVISDILDISKIEAGRMEFHPERVDVRSAVESVAAVMRGVADGRRIGIELDVPAGLPDIETDPGRLKQVLYNLLSNAVKFSAEGSAVTVSARALPQSASPLGRESVRLSVEDRGIGIALADRDLIFQEFRQADSASTREAGGTGLGLALVKRFVELQGGVVSVESELGSGSTFSATLPVRAGTAMAVPARVAWHEHQVPEEGGMRKRADSPPPPEPRARTGSDAKDEPLEDTSSLPLVLFVEDDPIGREVFEAMLGEEGYRLVAASDGPEALAKASECPPDVILLDVMMPGMDGFEVLRRLRADARLADVPVVMVTALADNESRLRGIEAGADDFLTKPIDRLQLRARVRTVTRLNRFRKLLTERDKFEWAVESADDGFLLLSPGDEIIYANPRARSFLGLPEGPLGPGWSGFAARAGELYRREPEAAWDSWAAHATGAVRYLVRPGTAGAQACWLQVEALTLPTGAQAGRLVRLKDVTESLQAQREAWTFHSAINHKLRTPLTTILPALEYLADPEASHDPKTTAQLARPALRSAQRLAAEIQDVLSFVEASRRPWDRSSFDASGLPELVARVAAEVGLTSVTTTVAEDLGESRIAFPSGALELVLGELFENSLKFHPRHAPEVEVVVLREPSGRASFVVRDDGTSLSPGQLAHVLTPYYQAEKTHTGQIAGMGLGLPMVATILWNAGGTCRVRNRSAGRGIEVELLLPFAR